MVLSVRSPHVWMLPAVMVLNCPWGGSLLPSASLPQHVMVLSVRSPQVCSQPAVMVLNCPSGGSLLPW